MTKTPPKERPKKERDRLIDEIGQFATIPYTVFKLLPVIGSDAFVMWCYLRYRSGTNATAFPSYDQMETDTGLRRARIADGLRSLENNGLLVRERRFSASTIYRLINPKPYTNAAEQPEEQPKKAEEQPQEPPSPISPTGGLMGDDDPLVRQVDYISPTGGLPLVRQAYTNKIQLTRFNQQDKNMGADAPAPVEGEDRPVVKNVGALRALAAFQKTHQADGCESFPEDVRPLVHKFCQLFHVKPPNKDGKKGGQFALWIADARYLRDAAGEFGLDILDCVFEDWRAGFKGGVPPFTVGRPGSLINVTRAKAGNLRAVPVPPSKEDQQAEEDQARALNEEMRRGREQRKQEGFAHA